MLLPAQWSAGERWRWMHCACSCCATEARQETAGHSLVPGMAGTHAGLEMRFACHAALCCAGAGRTVTAPSAARSALHLQLAHILPSCKPAGRARRGAAQRACDLQRMRDGRRMHRNASAWTAAPAGHWPPTRWRLPATQCGSGMPATVHSLLRSWPMTPEYLNNAWVIPFAAVQGLVL